MGVGQELEVDDVIEEIGGFGRYQFRLFFVLGYNFFCNGALNLQQVCTHHFRLPMRRLCAAVLVGRSGANHMMLVARLICGDARQVVVERRPSCLDGGLEVPCSASAHCTDGDGAFQGQFAHGSSVAAEFELVCTRTIFRGSLGSLFFIGFGFGSFLAGRMADRVGRRKTIRVFNALMLGGSMSFLAPSFETYLVLRVLAGVACGGNIVVVYVLMMEFVGKAHRGWMGGIGMNGLWALGGAAVALHAAWMHALWNPAGAAPHPPPPPPLPFVLIGHAASFTY